MGLNPSKIRVYTYDNDTILVDEHDASNKEWVAVFRGNLEMLNTFDPCAHKPGYIRSNISVSLRRYDDGESPTILYLTDEQCVGRRFRVAVVDAVDDDRFVLCRSHHENYCTAWAEVQGLATTLWTPKPVDETPHVHWFKKLLSYFLPLYAGAK